MSDLSLTVILHNAEQAAMAIRKVSSLVPGWQDTPRDGRGA